MGDYRYQGVVGLNGRTEPFDPGTHGRGTSRGPTVVGSPNPADSRTPGLPVDAPWSGGIPFGAGLSSVVRIPIPGTNGLCIEFSPRGWVPKGGSTSTLFFQDIAGKRHLRLDYGYNTQTKTVDYHWNQKSTHPTFGIADHAPAGQAGKVAYNAAKYFRYAGRVLLVVGVAVDVISVVQADRPLRQATKVVAGWASAWAGCKVVGAGGAWAGSFASPLGTAIGGVGGCIIGGIGGYYVGSAVAGEVFDWAEGTQFTPLEEAPGP